MAKSKKGLNITGGKGAGTGHKDDPPGLPLPEPPPGRLSSSDVPASPPAPRAGRFGEGPEGRGARRERGISGAQAGFFARASQFLTDVRSELKRVSWPSAKDVKNTTIITLIAVTFFAVYLWAVDRVLTFVVTQLELLINWIFGGA